MGRGNLQGLILAPLLLLSISDAFGQTIFKDGFETPCSQLDEDGDRLTGCQEAETLTNPHNADTDGDGLSDGDEVLGTLPGLDLPAFGVNPRRKDLLVEMDWTEDAFECPQHSHRVTPQIAEEVRIFYASIPIANPNGVSGINFIADYGQGGIFTGGNMIAIADGITSPLQSPFYAYKDANFANARRGYFRYQLHGHRWAYGQWSSGRGLIGGDDSVVTLQCQTAVPGFVRNTVIHELGHNLSLMHGGNSACNGKPNYNSLMNYRHQFLGTDVDCDSTGEDVNHLGYSDGSRIVLDAQAMAEAAGVCVSTHPLHKPVDWNRNNMIDPGLVAYTDPLTDCGPSDNPMTDWNDYAALQVAPGTPQDGGAAPSLPVSESCASPPVPE